MAARIAQAGLRRRLLRAFGAPGAIDVGSARIICCRALALTCFIVAFPITSRGSTARIRKGLG